jgi:hypothetical protein
LPSQAAAALADDSSRIRQVGLQRIRWTRSTPSSFSEVTSSPRFRFSAPVKNLRNVPARQSMPDATTRSLPPYNLAREAQKHDTHNWALRILDGLV